VRERAGSPVDRLRGKGKAVPGWLVIAASLVIGGLVVAVAGVLSAGPRTRALPTVRLHGAPTSTAVAGTAPAHTVPSHKGASPGGARTGRHGRTAAAASARPVSSLLPYAPAMTGAAPAGLVIPSIGVNASVIALGTAPDGQVEVPPLTEPMLASWFDDGPAPGQDGPAAIYGHVDTAATGPGVFYRLGDLAIGADADVTLADGQVAVFEVYRVAEYPKDAFPTMAVYGDTDGPELRLITCGGAFDPALGSYDDNIVVYARLVAEHNS
jgi:sortase (surface protein transpeptidase)